MNGIKKRPLVSICAGLLLSIAFVAFLAGRANSAAPPLPPMPAATQSYSAQGRGTMTVDGPGCCDGVVFPSTFEMNYELDNATGRVNITRLYTTLADMDVTFRFLIFDAGRVHIRCGTARTETAIEGTVDPSGNLTIATGAATLFGSSYQQRDATGDCGGDVSAITLSNNAPFTGLLDPASNRLSLAGVFSAITEGQAYTVRVDMSGDYLNRPPVASLGVEGTGLEAFSQGGCPAVMNGGNPPEPTIEANDPSGLKIFLKSFSRDPDGAWLGADLRFDQWFHGRDSEPIKFIGESRRLGPVIFEFGRLHHLELETTDRSGALARSACVFRVVDTTPPTVTAPGSATVEESTAGGATPSTSDALRDFLDSPSATDTVASAPSSMPPLVNGKEVTKDTLFPPGSWLEVTFRFVDGFGNVGVATSSVKVVAAKK